MKFTIIDMDVFETILTEINNLTDVVAKLHQDHGDKRLEKWLTNQDVCKILNIGVLCKLIAIPGNCLILRLIDIITTKDDRIEKVFKQIEQIKIQTKAIKENSHPSLCGERYLTDVALSAKLSISR